MAKLQSDRYERVYFHKIQMEYYCLGQNHASGTLISNLFGVKVHTSCKKFYILGGQKPTWANFLEFRFFFTRKVKTIQVLPEQKSAWFHIIFIHKSYIEIVEKIQKQPKNQGKNEILHFWKTVSQFCFIQALHFFRLHSAPRNDAD